MDQIDVRRVEELFADSGRDVYNRVAETIDKFGMIEHIRSGVLVGLSGGADSVMLLCFLMEFRRRCGLDFPILAVHVNHGIRGDEADADEEFCRCICLSLCIELEVLRLDVPFQAKRFNMGIEEAARYLRYYNFDRIILGRDDINSIAVAHNMSDCAETVVFNILRGSGARGASGIPPIRDNIFRPLINISKAEILSCLDKAGVPYVIDSTNLSDEYTRNYIRQKIIPSFERVTEDPEKMLFRFADNMRSDEDFIRGCAERFITDHDPIRNSDLLALHSSVFVRVLSIMAAKVNASVSYKIASDIRERLVSNNFSYSLIGSATFVCERGECRVSRQVGDKIDYCYAIGEGDTDLSPLNAHFVLSKEKIDKTYSNVYKISIQANLSSAIIKGSLYLRPKKDGDTVYYGGMTHKLKKLFSDRKIPPSKRKLIPILCDDSGVVWVPGFGVRDDGVSIEERKDIFVLLGITPEDDAEKDRLYSGSEFRS